MKVLWTSDADNTLWDTNSAYTNAQLNLLHRVEEALQLKIDHGDRLQYIRDIDQRISKLHHLGLRYPTEILVSALTKQLQGIPSETAIKRSLLEGTNHNNKLAKALSDEFQKQSGITPPLREGVLEGLEKLHQQGATIVVATEGSLNRVKRHLRDHNIEHLISLCIESPKSRALYERIAKLHQDKQAWSIGDQVARDIQPAIEAGFRTIYFPGGFNPFWQESATLTAETKTVSNYKTGVEIALKILDQESNSPSPEKKLNALQSLQTNRNH